MDSSNGDFDTEGPPPPSPLTGCYLLIVVGEPHSEAHRDIILQRIKKGLLSWDRDESLVDLEKELLVISDQALEGELAKNGERLIQFASENLVTEILIHPAVSTLVQCMKNLLGSFTRHRHIIHAGYTFTANGSWILQDGTFSYTDFLEAFEELESQRVIHAYENGISLDLHCSSEGEWYKLPKESFTKGCIIRVNPSDVLTCGSSAITHFIKYMSQFIIPTSLEDLLECSDVVGNIRFSRPTLYVFPGGQGDAALFGVNGFNMLLDGGFSRKACFWDFVRHLDRLDAVLMTRLNNGNIGGISSIIKRKKKDAIYPHIGHFFSNIPDRKATLSPDGDKDRDPLLIDLLKEGQDLISNLQHLGLTPQVCYKDSEPINLYHKVGHGTLNMYVLNPGRDSKEVKEFLQKWNQSDQKLFCKSHKEFTFPIQNLVSIAVLLIWQPANINDTITRILYPGSTPQNKVFEGLDKIKNIEYINHPVCSEKTLFPKFSKKKFLKNNTLEKTVSREKSVEKKQKRDENITVYGADVIEKNVQKRETKKMEEHKLFIENDEKFKENKRIKLKNQQQKKPSFDKKDYSVTPKKNVDQEGLKKSVATPAKSTKDANNRKVLENKTKSIKSSTGIVKSENKSISRTSKVLTKTPFSPSKRMMNGAQKNNNILKKGTTDKDGTTDSSTVSTPTADQNSLKKDINLTLEEIHLKAQERDDLEEEQEAIKEIEAVFKKSEAQLFEDESMRRIKNSPTDEDKSEKEEFVAIEKEQIDSSMLKKLADIPKLTRDNEESEKLKNSRFYKPSKKEIIEVIKNKENVDVVSGSHEEKVEILSNDKKSDKDTEIKDAVESHPEEKVSANIKSGDTTTAPTLPEDERIPLDDVKEDTANQIEEKYVKEETKEKYVPIIQLPPKAFDCLAKSSAVVGIRLDKQNLIRDIVKTPDEVADLPVHEEVDYEYAQETKSNIKSNDAQDDIQTDIGQPDSHTIQQGHAYNIVKEKSDEYKTCDFSTVNEESKQKNSDSNEEKSFQRGEKEDGQIQNGKIHTLNELLKKSNESISDLVQIIPKENETIGKIQESKPEADLKNKLEDQREKLVIHQLDVALEGSESKNNNIIFGEVTGGEETPSRVVKSIEKDAKDITESNQDSTKSNEKKETGLSFKENAKEINCRQSENSLNTEGIKYECNTEKDITKNVSFKQYEISNKMQQLSESEVKGKVNTAEKSDKVIMKNVIFETSKHKESDIDLETYKSEEYINCTTGAKIKSNLEETSPFDEESRQVREESIKNKNSSNKVIGSPKEVENEGLIPRLDIETESHNVHCFEEKEDDLIEDKTDAEISDFKTQSIGHIFYDETKDTNVHVKLEKEDFNGGNKNRHIIVKGETHQFKQVEKGFNEEDKNKHDTTTDEAHELIQKAEELYEEDKSIHSPTIDEDSQSKQKEKPNYEDEDKNKHITSIDEEYEAKQEEIINDEDKNKHITAIDLNYESTKQKVVEYNKEDEIKHITAIDENQQLKQKEKEKEDIKENGSKLTEKEFFEKYKIEDFPAIDETRHSKQKEKPSYEDEDKNKHITAIDEEYEAKQEEVINDEDKNKHITAIDLNYESTKQKVVEYNKEDEIKHITAIDENQQLKQKEKEKEDINENGSKLTEKECFEKYKIEDFPAIDETRHSNQKEKPSYEDEDKNKHITAIDEDYEAKENEVINDKDKNKSIIAIDKDHESKQKVEEYSGKDENKHITAIDEKHQLEQKEKEKERYEENKSKDFPPNDEDHHMTQKEKPNYEEDKNKHIAAIDEYYEAKEKEVTNDEDKNKRITNIDKDHESKQKGLKYNGKDENKPILTTDENHQFNQKEEEKDNIKQKRSNHKETEYIEENANKHISSINEDNSSKQKKGEEDTSEHITAADEAHQSKQTEKEIIEIENNRYIPAILKDDNEYKQTEEELNETDRNKHTKTINNGYKPKQKEEEFNEEDKNKQITEIHEEYRSKQKEEFKEDKKHITVIHEDSTSKLKEEFDGENKNEHISAIDGDHKYKQKKEEFNEENKKNRILSTDKDHEPKQKEDELLSLEINSSTTSDIHKDLEKLVDAPHIGRLEKDHKENVIKIVSTVAEVLKSDASLEELEEKLSLSFDPAKVSCITELRETHITTSELSDKDVGINSGIILSVSEENVSIIDENDENKLETNLFNKSLETTRNEYVKETEKQMDSADEQGTVQRMLVTTSSEDGREEIEICPVGTIIFSKSSDSSGRSSPEKSQESKKSSIVDTFSESVITAKEFSEAALEKSADTFNAAKNIQQEVMNIVTEEIYLRNLDYTPTSVTATDTVDNVDKLVHKTKETYDITNSEQDSASIKDILELHSVNKIENDKTETKSNIEFEECSSASFEKNKVRDINIEKDIDSNVSSTKDNVVEDTKSKISEYSTSVKEPDVVVDDLLLTNNDLNKLENENKEDKRELRFEETEVKSPKGLINKSIDISGDNKQIQIGITESIDKKLIRSNQPEDYPSLDSLVMEESVSSHEVLSNNSNIYFQDEQKEIKEYLMYTKNTNLMEQSVYGSLNDVEESNSIYLFEITSAKYIARCPENDDIYNGTDNKDSSSISLETDIDVPVIVRNTKKYVETQDLQKPLETSCYLYEITNATYTSTLYEHIDNQNSSMTDKHDRSYAYEITKAQQLTRNTDICKKEKSSHVIYSPGKPLSLPSPAPPNDNTGTPKKEVKLPSNVASKNKWNDDKKRSEWSLKLKKKTSPIYVDLTYVPHHGNSYYAYLDFFKIVRARYYVFSGVEPGKEVYNALLEAKQTWDDKSLEVTIIPTYDTDILGYWVAENEELLAKYKIDLSPSASRCTINLQDHETSCSAYRLEF